MRYTALLGPARARHRAAARVPAAATAAVAVTAVRASVVTRPGLLAPYSGFRSRLFSTRGLNLDGSGSGSGSSRSDSSSNPASRAGEDANAIGRGSAQPHVPEDVWQLPAPDATVKSAPSPPDGKPRTGEPEQGLDALTRRYLDTSLPSSPSDTASDAAASATPESTRPDSQQIDSPWGAIAGEEMKLGYDRALPDSKTPPSQAASESDSPFVHPSAFQPASPPTTGDAASALDGSATAASSSSPLDGSGTEAASRGETSAQTTSDASTERKAAPTASPSGAPASQTAAQAEQDAQAAQYWHDHIPDEYKKRFAELKESLDKKSRELAVQAGIRTRELARQANANLTFAGRRVNEVTGYQEVEKLKRSVKEREHDLETRRQDVRAAKLAYDEAVLKRTTSQQNVNNLLERKHSWTDHDVADFTMLVRSDHASRHAVTDTSERLKAAEIAMDKAFTAFMQSILERYHEEQVWSEKIRSVSNWTHMAALAVNFLVFVGAVVFIEPWKRRRLVQGLEERMRGMMARVEGEISTLAEHVGGMDAKLLATAALAIPATVVSEGAALESLERGLTPEAGVSAAEAESEATAAETGSAAMASEVETAALEGAELAAAEMAQPDLSSPAVLPSPELDASGLEHTGVDVPESTASLTEVQVAPLPLSPLEQLSAHMGTESHPSKAVSWVSQQLSHVAPPSVERDLAAAGMVGAVGGAVVVGLVGVVARLMRG